MSTATTIENSLAICDATGHTEVKWDPSDPTSTELAKAAFDAAKKKGLRAFRLDEDGERGRAMDTWDPSARAIVMTAPLIGG